MNGNERFFLSCDINLPVTFRIGSLEGSLPESNVCASEIDFTLGNQNPELYCECSLYIDGAKFGLPIRTRLESSGLPICWNELITLNTKYRDLTAHAQLAITVWDMSSNTHEGLVGGATVLLFNRKKSLKTGKQKLRLWPGKEADGSFPSTTPGKVPRQERSELERLEKLINKYERGKIQRIDWLDIHTFKAIEKIKEKESETSHMSLLVDFCSFEHRVVFQVRLKLLEVNRHVCQERNRRWRTDCFRFEEMVVTEVMRDCKICFEIKAKPPDKGLAEANAMRQ